MIYQKNPESDATQPTGEHISIVVFSPLKIINPNIGWVCFCAVQVKPAFKTWLFFFSPFEICLEKTKLISMLYSGHTTFFQKWSSFDAWCQSLPVVGCPSARPLLRSVRLRRCWKSSISLAYLALHYWLPEWTFTVGLSSLYCWAHPNLQSPIHFASSFKVQIDFATITHAGGTRPNWRKVLDAGIMDLVGKHW